MKEKIGNLVRAILENEKDHEEITLMLDATDKALDSFRKYFNAVFQDVKAEEIGRAQLNVGFIEPDEFREMREDTDSSRRIAHDNAIANCGKLNRYCKMYGLEPFCPETDDRHEIADFIGTFVYNIYQEGIGAATIDKAYNIANDSFEARTEYFKRVNAIENATANRYPKKDLGLDI